jgi:enoyl-CoA hydratase/carnithine racemase
MTVRIAREGRVLRLTIDRPEHENRLDPPTLVALQAALRDVTADRDPVSVVILDACGPDFSLGRQRDPAAPTNPKAITDEFTRIQQVNEALSDCRAVTIAALHGRAEGAGLSLAARCDIVVVADDARLSFPEIPHGIPPTIVLSHYRYVLPQHILGDLIFTGRQLDGREAVRFGLAARHVPADQLSTAVTALADEVAGHDRDSIRLVKQFLGMTRTLSPRDAPATGIALYAVEMADRAATARSTTR